MTATSSETVQSPTTHSIIRMTSLKCWKSNKQNKNCQIRILYSEKTIIKIKNKIKIFSDNQKLNLSLTDLHFKKC